MWTALISPTDIPQLFLMLFCRIELPYNYVKKGFCGVLESVEVHDFGHMRKKYL